MNALFALVFEILDLYKMVIFIYVIASWLLAFRVLNPYNRFVKVVWDILIRLVEPACRQIRRVVPPLGGIDVSPLILLLAVYFVQRLLVDFVGPQVTYL